MNLNATTHSFLSADMERVRNLIAKHGLADGKRENI